MIRTDEVSPQTFRRAVTMVRGREWLETLTTAMTARTGRPRIHSWEAVFVVLQITALEGFGSLLLTDASRVAQRLSAAQREDLGLTVPLEYSHLESALADLAAACEERIDPDTGEVHPPRLPMTLAELLTSITASFIPASIPATSTQSIDSTDYETYARRRSWSKDAIPDVPAEALPEEAAHDVADQTSTPGWPRIGCDGRLQHTIDPDAREGYRSGKNLHRKETFMGWDVHLGVDTPDLGSEALPPLIRAMAFSPAGTLKSEPGLAVVDALAGMGNKPTTVCVDRGYSYLTAEHWAGPLGQRGVDQVFDLQRQQRGHHPGPIPGTIFIDGGLFIDTVPEDLRSLSGYGLNQTAAEKALLAKEYDKRARYAFKPLGRPDHARGTQRYRGPAITKQVKCSNNPETKRLPDTHPDSGCIKGKPCACGTTVTLGPSEDDYFWLRQRPLFGTTAWKASYGRRSAVEAANACLKVHHANLRRGSTRVRGTVKNGILVALITAAVNASLLLTRYGYDLDNPPGDDEPVAPFPSPRTALHRRRAFSRRRARSKDPSTAPPRRPGTLPIQPSAQTDHWKRPTETLVTD